MARVLGYGGVANTRAKTFSGKTPFVPVEVLGGRITNIASHFTNPTEISSWLIPLIQGMSHLLGRSS